MARRNAFSGARADLVPKAEPTYRELSHQTTAEYSGNLLLLKLRGFGRIIGPETLNIGNPRRTTMAILIVMDRTGDSRHRFDPNDAQELAKAEQRFRELTNEGFTAAVRTGPGEVSQIRSFDALAKETVFFPRLVGG